MDAPGSEETHRTFPGARAGELLLVSGQEVALMAGGSRQWHVAHTDIRAVLTVRRVRDGMVHDAVHVCATDGRDRHFLVAMSHVRDDYDAEFAEAVADATAAALRRAAGL